MLSSDYWSRMLVNPPHKRAHRHRLGRPRAGKSKVGGRLNILALPNAFNHLRSCVSTYLTVIFVMYDSQLHF